MRRKWILFLCIVGIAVCTGGCAAHGEAKTQTKEQTEAQTRRKKERVESEKTETEKNRMEETARSIEMTETESRTEETSQEILQDGAEGMEELKVRLEAMLLEYQGDWAVYVSDLKNKEYLEINNHAVKSASLIKLYIMGAVLEQEEAGNLKDDRRMEKLLKKMITVSDNEASNELVRMLSPDGTNHPEGMEVVNAFAQAGGYGDTSQGRDMQDVREVPVEGENYTSVRDCGHFLENVYYGTCVSAEASEKMLELLKKQKRTWKIPAGVPEGVVTANKTGELKDTENDAAIVFSPGGDYILCVTATELADHEKAEDEIVQLSAAVYQYMNDRLRE